MASGTAIIGVDITDVDVGLGNAQFALGARGAVDSQSGVREYMYVQFAASTAFVVGDVVVINGNTFVATPVTTANGAPGQSTGRRIGVVVAPVASSAAPQYGWVQVFGPALVRVAASTLVNTPLNTTTTPGVLDDDATAGVRLIDGIVLNVTSPGSVAATAATLNYPFIGRTL